MYCCKGERLLSLSYLTLKDGFPMQEAFVFLSTIGHNLWNSFVFITCHWKPVFVVKYYTEIAGFCSKYNRVARSRQEVLEKCSRSGGLEQHWPSTWLEGEDCHWLWLNSAFVCKDLQWNPWLTLQPGTAHPASGHQDLFPVGSHVNKYLPLHPPRLNWADL